MGSGQSRKNGEVPASMKKFNDFLEEQLKDPEFRQIWEETKVEYEVARQLILLRKQKGLTQSQLAERLNTKQSVISRIETGDQNITLENLMNIVKALGGQLQITISGLE
jgi:ribosome-binding protein aMBF1 (putative translation factor)